MAITLRLGDWRAAFERESRAVEAVLDGLGAVRIEHVGSTAIPGIRAKPILDVMVGVGTYDRLDESRRRLESLGYVYDAAALRDDPGRHVFRKGPADPSLPRTHHLHYTILDGPYWVRIVAFRDYLRAHRDVAMEYERLKLSLARTHGHDGKAYTRGKGEFVRRVQAIALREGLGRATS